MRNFFTSRARGAYLLKSGASHDSSDATAVGMTGFEPATLRSQSGCATKLRHIPVSPSFPTQIQPSEVHRKGVHSKYSEVSTQNSRRANATPPCYASRPPTSKWARRFGPRPGVWVLCIAAGWPLLVVAMPSSDVLRRVTALRSPYPAGEEPHVSGLEQRRCECSLMVKPLPSKQDTRVRFPSLAPLCRRRRAYGSCAFTHFLVPPLWKYRIHPSQTRPQRSCSKATS